MTPSSTSFISADEWFQSGERVLFNPTLKKMVTEKSKSTVAVFERVVTPRYWNESSRWLTLLPGFPQGSYGYAKMDALLSDEVYHTENIPRLFVEYVGHGDSDKPSQYNYSTLERADLVEAQWAAHHIQTTVVVSADFSTLVVLELLYRQQLRDAKGIRFPRIEHVLSINGALFADGHSKSGSLVPLPFQRASSMKRMVRPSADYKRKTNRKQVRDELKETHKAIRLHKGSSVTSTSQLVKEHQKYAVRWDLTALYKDYCKDQGITWHMVGSQEERRQLDLARHRLRSYYPSVQVEVIPGGHRSLVEQATVLTDRVGDLLRRESFQKPQRSWASVNYFPSSTATKTHQPSALSSAQKKPQEYYQPVVWGETQIDYGLSF